MKRAILVLGIFWGIILGAFFGVNYFEKKEVELNLAPETFAEMYRVEDIKGNAAIAAVNDLHGKLIDIKAAEVITYKNYQQEARIWISEANSVQEAAYLCELMDRKIKAAIGKSPFSYPETLEIGGLTIYKTYGMGRVHYYYQSKDKVFWLELPAELHQDLLKEALKIWK
ncbi:hypothetical protein ciss_17920 [Carboxydothermus islandicus]|uniref:Uncharacterized protein n=1 Tax=Carboxydothermus islandicus TaxID=661089 RepID=A0A1L8D3X1_9THEO|nr:hypothetical protein [Carboxydothermus islandicus]GAV25859.1 hypothetical protein ciss_17920 [Carboxydothermus islandicus]